MLACLLAALASGSFARFHCVVFHIYTRIYIFFLHDAFHLFFLQAQKQFRYAARCASTLTATEQFRTQVMRAAYPHLTTFASCG